MSHGHVCDHCNRTAPVGAAAGWWELTELGEVSMLTFGEKAEYQFCSKSCVVAHLRREGHRPTDEISLIRAAQAFAARSDHSLQCSLIAGRCVCGRDRFVDALAPFVQVVA